MNALGQPARDYIVATDERNRARMEQGSLRLLHAIEDYYIARAQRRSQRAA